VFEFYGDVTTQVLSDSEWSDHLHHLAQGSPTHISRSPQMLTIPGAGVIGYAPGVSMAHAAKLIAVIAGRPQFQHLNQQPANPAACLLELWQQHQQQTPTYVHGSFAFAILNVHTQELMLAIDRIGIQSLCFGLYRDGVVFGQRADCLANHPRINAQLNLQAIFQYCYFSMIPAPDTIFAGIEKLLPGQCIYIHNGQVERHFYWHLQYRDAPRHDFATQKQRFHQLLHDCVAQACDSDHEPAAFLSGGTDSSTVAGFLTTVRKRPARTYSIGFAVPGFDEMAYARLAAQHFGLDAQEYYLTPDDVATTIPLIAQHYDEPFANESAVSVYHCARLAKADGYQVMLGGDGGDEIFGGNARYAQQRLFEWYQHIPGFMRTAILEQIVKPPFISNHWPGRKLSRYIEQANIPLPERMETYNFIYRQPLSEMFTSDFLQAIDDRRPQTLLDDVYHRAASQHYINRMLHLDLKITLADNDLRKVSRMVEAAGMEARYPLLNDAMVAFSGEIPPDWKVKRMYLRWFFKTALQDRLPATIINKRKQGFGLPFGLWLREQPVLREQAHDRLADFGRRGWIQPSYLDQLHKNHETVHATYFGRMIWMLLILEEWLVMRRF
jgi:asparagine synthase (glutamine-hydrolysing)